MNDQDQPDINVIIRNGYSVDIGDFLSRGWKILRSNLGLFFVFELFTFVVGNALEYLPTGIAALFVMSTPLYAGGLIVAFRVAKGQEVRFKNFFDGFKKAYFFEILLITLMVCILIVLCFIPAVITFQLSGIGSNSSHALSSEISIDVAMLILTLLLAILGILGAIYVGVSYFFAIPLVIGLRMDCGPAMEASRKLVHRNWLGMFGLNLVIGLIFFCSLPFGELGEIITDPLETCIIAAAYERIIGLPNFDSSQD